MSKRLKVAVVGTVGLPAKYGGFETLTEYLVENLNNDFDFTVYCSKKAYSKRVKVYKRAQLVYLPFNANGASSIIYDFTSIMHAVFYSEVILILGVSAAFAIPLIKLFTNKTIITNIDGLEWKRDKWNNQIKKYLKLQEKIAVQFSNHVVADNQSIVNHVLKSYGKESKLIAYGGDHVKKLKLLTKLIEKYNLPKKYAFKVCRIEPENNISMIIEAFSQTNINLVIIGNWNNSEYGRVLKKKYNNENLFLLDPIYDQEDLNQIRSNCFAYIHGHSAGGTNPSLVEAMNLKLPIIAFDVDYNRYTTKNSAIYFNSSSSLIYILINQLDDVLLYDNAKKMINIANEEYQWAKISAKYKVLFLKKNS